MAGSPAGAVSEVVTVYVPAVIVVKIGATLIDAEHPPTVGVVRVPLISGAEADVTDAEPATQDADPFDVVGVTVAVDVQPANAVAKKRASRLNEPSRKQFRM